MKKTGYTKLLAKKHTGKLRQHKHTSFVSLLAIVVLAAVPIIVVSQSVAIADDSYTTYAVVPGPTPKAAPTITSPVSGAVYTNSNSVSVQGNCPGNTLVKLFKNEVLAGAALCVNGTYQMNVGLFVGNNSLIARAYNANDAVSPDSLPVSVQLQLPGSKLTSTSTLNVNGAPAGQFYMTSEVFHRGHNAHETISWPVTLDGGQAPYAVNVSWGDGKTDLISRGTAGRFDISHVYDRPAGSNGSYKIIIKASDQAGTATYLQLAAIITGVTPPSNIAGGLKQGYNASAAVKMAAQGLAVAALVVLSFWLGEKREIRLLRHV